MGGKSMFPSVRMLFVAVYILQKRLIHCFPANLKFTESQPIEDDLEEHESETTTETIVPEENKTIVSHAMARLGALRTLWGLGFVRPLYRSNKTTVKR